MRTTNLKFPHFLFLEWNVGLDVGSAKLEAGHRRIVLKLIRDFELFDLE